MTRIVIFLFTLTVQASVYAELYQWRDKNGRQQYSDSAPGDGTDYQVIDESTLPLVHTIQSVKPGTVYKDTSSVKRSLKGGIIAMPKRLGDEDTPDWNCGKVKKKLDTIDRQLRQGYSWDRGVKLRRDRQKYRDYYYNECR